jgi:uncharacterized membrane protein YccC
MIRSDPPLITRAELRLALTTGLSAGLAITLGLPDPFYAPLAVAAVLGGTVGASRTLGIQRLLGTLMGGLIVAVLHPTLSPILPMPIGVAIALACTRVFGGSLGLHSGYKVAGLVVSVGWTAHAAEIDSWVPIRLVLTLLGVLVAWVAIQWFWPSRALERRQELSVQLFREFAIAFRDQAALMRGGEGLCGAHGLERQKHLLDLILEQQGQRTDAAVELGSDWLGQRLARLWDRQEQLWSALLASYRTLVRLPPLPRRHGSLAHLLEAKVALLEAVADRLEQWALVGPTPPRWRTQTTPGNGDALQRVGRDLETAEMGLFEDPEAAALLLAGSGGRRAVTCQQVLRAVQGFEQAWRATP